MTWLGSIQIVQAPNMVVPEHTTVQRTWAERLFTRPWQPRKATKVITKLVPDRTVIHLDGKLFCHPEVAAQIAKAIEDRGNGT